MWIRLTALICLISPVGAQTAFDASGSWSGYAQLPGQTVGVVIALENEGAWAGTVDAPSVGMTSVPLLVAVDGDSLRLAVPGGVASMAGRYDPVREVVEGTVTSGAAEGPFALARTGSSEAARLARILAAWNVAPSPHPDSARVVTEDIDRFWAAIDASTPETRAAVLQRDYLDRGTIGLDDFVGLRIESADLLAETFDAHPRYYASAREPMSRLGATEPEIRAIFRRMEALYPEAVYPDVYFLVGRLTSGGTLSQRGLLLGAEMFGRTPDMPGEELSEWHRHIMGTVDVAPAMVAHELIHYQQSPPPPFDWTLLSRAIHEGAADYLSTFIADGDHVSWRLHEQADPIEREVWCDFRTEMGGQDVSRWFDNGNRSGDRPASLGYYVGYQIAEAYHERARAAGADDAQVVRDVLHIDDAAAFLEASGYADRFACDG